MDILPIRPYKIEIQITTGDESVPTVPRYILVRENMPVRGLGVNSYTSEMRGTVESCVEKLAEIIVENLANGQN
jgi:hypothetical protein